jgi:hydroxymethylpyrimidine pyrophosphatase-like HAD family hydrolase
MRFRVLACDYDRTIAQHGLVSPAALASLVRVRESGRRLILATGRTRGQLEPVMGAVAALFDRLVLENGAVLLDPATGRHRLLCEPIPARFVEELRRREAGPLVVGRGMVSTGLAHLGAVEAVIAGLRLDLHTVVNIDTVMALPSRVSKASGAREALTELGEEAAACVAVGDGENDVALLEMAGCAVALANSLPCVAAVADLVLSLPDGAGVAELAAQLVADDLAGLLEGAGSRSR